MSPYIPIISFNHYQHFFILVSSFSSAIFLFHSIIFIEICKSKYQNYINFTDTHFRPINKFDQHPFTSSIPTTGQPMCMHEAEDADR